MNDKIIAFVLSIVVGAGSFLFSSINESRVIHIKSQFVSTPNDGLRIVYTITNSSSTLGITGITLNLSCGLLACLPEAREKIDVGRVIGFFVTKIDVKSSSKYSYTASMNLAAGAVVQFGIPVIKDVEPPKLSFEVDSAATSRLLITENDWVAFLASKFYDLIGMGFLVLGIFMFLFGSYRLMLGWGARNAA